MTSPFVVQANTPEDLRKELLSWFNNLRASAQTHSRIRNQAVRVRLQWEIRDKVLGEAVEFLTTLHIEGVNNEPLDEDLANGASP